MRPVKPISESPGFMAVMIIGLTVFGVGVGAGIVVVTSTDSIRHARYCERIADAIPLFGDCSR